MPDETSKSFRQAADQKPASLGREVVEMLKHNKKYWMIPIVLILVLFGLLIIFGATSAAPFIYTLF